MFGLFSPWVFIYLFIFLRSILPGRTPEPRGTRASPGTAPLSHSPTTTCLWLHRTAGLGWSPEPCETEKQHIRVELVVPMNNYILNKYRTKFSHQAKKIWILSSVQVKAQGQGDSVLTVLMPKRIQLMLDCNEKYLMKYWALLNKRHKTTKIPTKWVTEIATEESTKISTTE